MPRIHKRDGNKRNSPFSLSERMVASNSRSAERRLVKTLNKTWGRKDRNTPGSFTGNIAESALILTWPKGTTVPE